MTTMQLLSAVILLLIVGVIPTPETDALLDSLLLQEGVTLTPQMLEYRRKVFAANLQWKGDTETVSLENMYTTAELEKQRGANLVPRDLFEMQTLEENITFWRGISTPAVFDPRRIRIADRDGNSESLMNKAVNQLNCGNCYLHSFVGALEIAYARAAGERIKFSEQEMTDCYYKGCDGGDTRMLAIFMSYIDKLSSREEYGPYMGSKLACRQATTPNSLSKVKVKGFVHVQADEVESAILAFGSVLACMDWGIKAGDSCRMDNYRPGTVVDYPGSDGACRHSVLIVGYTPTLYIVRNSHGVTWGDQGYFYIRRGTNSCGIEDHMDALVVESRTNSLRQLYSKTGCPIDTPKFCKSINTCVAVNQPCIQSKKRVQSSEQMQNSALQSRGRLISDSNEIAPEALMLLGPRKMLSRHSRCKDEHPRCGDMVKTLTCNAPSVRKMCKWSCFDCERPELTQAKKEDPEVRGMCLRPVIPHGRALNTPIMRTDEILRVECDEGYTLSGNPVKCLIQNVFVNSEDKDGRLLPECVKLGSDELIGNGAGYTGSKNTIALEDGQGTIECGNWNKNALEGMVLGYKRGRDLALGNHNYCRNPGGRAPVPVCLVRDEVTKNTIPMFCFEHPGCDTCHGVTGDNYARWFCEEQRDMGYCAYKTPRTLERVKFVWENCPSTCCEKYCSD